MKKIAALIFMLVLTAGFASAQTVYWLLFTDTADERVGEPSKNSRDFYHQIFMDNVNTVLRQSGFKIKEIDIYGEQLSPDKCREVVKTLSCTDKDIVIYYSISHGSRNQENDPNNPWPLMWMGGHEEDNLVSLKWVHEQLKAKGPRLLLTVGMCCNSDYGAPLKARYGYSYGATYGVSPESIKLVKSLFLEKYGDILVTSTSPGHTSGCCMLGEGNNQRVMDLFTAFYCYTFDEILAVADNITWEEFLGQVKSSVFGFSKQENENSERKNPVHIQEPIFSINISDSPIILNNPPEPPAPNSEAREVLEECMAAVSNSSFPFGKRQRWRKEISELFAPNAVVKKLSKDGRKVLDVVDAPDYLENIATSNIIQNIVVVDFKLNNDRLISEIKVKEVVLINNKIR